MTQPTKTPVVECFDQMQRNYRSGGLWKMLLALLILLGSSAIGRIINAHWPEVIAFIVIAGTLVLPQIFRVHRGYADQICPSCDRPAGGYETNNSRIILVCKHCGAKTPTDCTVQYAGGPPTKV